MTERGDWKEVDAEKPASGEEEVVVRKVKRRYRVRTRLASCFCSQCQISRYEECHNITYPALVPALMHGKVKETVIMDTGVLPVGVDEPQQIKFRPRAKECRVSRVTGTQWEVSDQASAQEFWENLEREEEPALVANLGQWAG